MGKYVVPGVAISKARFQELTPLYGKLNATTLKTPAVGLDYPPLHVRFETFAGEFKLDDQKFHGELRFDVYDAPQAASAEQTADLNLCFKPEGRSGERATSQPAPSAAAAMRAEPAPAREPRP